MLEKADFRGPFGGLLWPLVVYGTPGAHCYSSVLGITHQVKGAKKKRVSGGHLLDNVSG